MTNTEGLPDGADARSANQSDLFGLKFSRYRSYRQAAEEMMDLRDGSPNGLVVHTCNVDHLVQLRQDSEFRRAYLAADVITADGAPIVLASRLLGNRIPTRITGVDLVTEMLHLAAVENLKVGVIGGTVETHIRFREVVSNRFKGATVPYTLSPPQGFESDAIQVREVRRRVEGSKCDLVVVCLGAPRQEKFIHANRDMFRGSVVVGAGASIDFISGTQDRAPLIFRRMGMEWLHRLTTDFRRLKRRYLVRGPIFLIVFVWELLGRRRGKDVTTR